MSNKSANDWYSKYKDSPAYVARKLKERAEKKTLTNLVSLKGRYLTINRDDKKRVKEVRYDPLVNRGCCGYKHNGHWRSM
jgi:hypothetical protein